ncbi:MAG TPA: Npt1/Npt2 family nucleotide transporter, partial [Labilithrix sp.]
LMTAHSFFMGCSTVFFETAASATFLARFPPAFLPWVYIAAAGANTVTGAVYSRLQTRASFSHLMRGTLVFLFALACVLRAGFALSTAASVAFAGLVSYRIVSSLTDLEYWAVASRIYDVRQAKRLFGLVGTGEVVARIVGSFSVPALVALGGVSNLLVISAAALAACLFLVGAVLREHHGSAPAKAAPPAPRSLRQVLGEIFENRYLTLVIVVAVLATFGKYFVDFAFLEQVATTGKGEESFATFLGIFNGLTQTLSLLTRLFVSRPLLGRFGIRVGVLVLPILHALCALATILSGFVGAPANVVFAFVIANQGVYKTFKHPIDNASFKVLYQPVKPEQRLAAQIAVEIVFSPIVVGVAGGVMLLFSAGMRYEPARFAFVLLATFVLWTFAARRAGRGYAQALLDVIRRRIEGNVTLPFDDATTLNVLRTHLDARHAEEVCATLDLLEKAAAPDLEALLVARIDHPDAPVRVHAIERLLALRPRALVDVRERLSADPEPTVRGAAAAAFVVDGDAHAIAALVRQAADPESIVKRAAVAALVHIGSEDSESAARGVVDTLARAGKPADRALAARMAGDHRFEAVAEVLLDDADVGVRRAAIDAAGRIRAPAFRERLLAMLDEPRLAQAAAGALAGYGPDVARELGARIRKDATARAVRRAVYAVSRLGGDVAIETLRPHFAFEDVTVRQRVLAALDRLGWTAREEERAAIERLVLYEARAAAWTVARWHDLTTDADAGSVRRALEEEIENARRRLFHLLAASRDRVAVHRAAHQLDRGTKDRRAYALEVLDILLEGEQRALVTPLLDSASNDTRRERLASAFEVPARSPQEALAEIATREARWIRP